MRRMLFRYSLSLVAAAALMACSTTQQVAVKKADLNCGFLLGDCSRLAAGAKDQAALRYVDSSANWTQYNKVLIDPVMFYGGDTTKVSAEEQQALTNYFYQVLREELGKKFEVVDQAGPGVMNPQVALTDAEAATPGLRTVSMVIPQARALNTLKYAATGTYAFVGGAQAEAKLTDAVSGQLLGEWVDKRIGGGSLETAAQWQWGDAENAMKQWATTAADRLSAWTSGTVKPA
jgi:Protein of unknown function (DUF3313)